MVISNLYLYCIFNLFKKKSQGQKLSDGKEGQNAGKMEIWVTHVRCSLFIESMNPPALNPIKASKWPHVVPRSSAKSSISIIYDDTQSLFWNDSQMARYQYPRSRQSPNLVFPLVGEITQLFLKCFVLLKAFSLLF